MKILLHCCCGPCAIYPIKQLKQQHLNITCLFYNPNIHPFKEFRRRLHTFSEFARSENIEYTVDDNYGLVEFTQKTVFNEKSRCDICYTMRLTKTAHFAAEGGFDSFSTTLLYSRYQQHAHIKKLAEDLAETYTVSFHYEDYRAGWQEGIDMSMDQKMYRQPYCGCLYSEQERYDKRLRKGKIL